MIESIELTNWKVHKHTKLDFKKGVNVLVGVMGAGKSSILDAISFGLFGSFPALSHRRTSLDAIITSKPDIASEAEVKVGFTIGDDHYTVSRRIARGSSSSARLDKNGAYLQAQPERVSEEIERILKIDYDTFSRVVYAEQNRLDYFLELVKGDRKRQIDQMLGLDNFARAEENTVSLANHMKDMVSGEEEGMSRIDTESLKKNMADLSAQRAEYADEQEKLEAKKASFEAHAKETSAQLSKSKSEYDKMQKLSKEIAEMLAKLGTLKVELEKIGAARKIDDIRKELARARSGTQKADDEIKKLRAEEREATKKLSDSESKLNDTYERLKERDKLAGELKNTNVKGLENDVHRLEEAMGSALKDLAASQSAASENEKWADELAKHITACPVCNRDLTPQLRNQLLEQKSELVRKARAEAAKLSEQVERFKLQKTEAERRERNAKIAVDKLSAYAGIDEKAERLKHNIAANKSELAKITDVADAKVGALDELKKEVSDLGIELDSASRKERYGAEIIEVSAVIDSKKKGMAEIKISEHDLDSLREKLSAEREELSKLVEKFSGNEKMLSSISAQIEEKAKSIAEAESIKARIAHRKKLIAELGRFRSALADTESTLRSELVKSINGMMQSIWPELYPYLDYPTIRLAAKNDDYVLEAATTMGSNVQQWADINSIASGGERSIACLAMRIALAMVVVPNLRWLILDEPTHNLDENGISRLIEVLGNSLPKVVDQIFVITHDNSLRSISPARIYQMERSKNEDKYANAVGIS